MIFISYRNGDARDLVARLDSDLSAAFGSGAVFRDKSRLRPGQDWPDELEQNAQSCAVMLVVIGSQWKSATFADGPLEGHPRLSDP